MASDVHIETVIRMINFTLIHIYGIKNFDSMKNKSVEYYSLPLTQKEFEELSRDEILKKRIEYLKENNLL